MTNTPGLRIGLILALAVLSSLLLAAEQNPGLPASTSRQVSLNVSVADRLGRFVNGVRESDFRIFEDNVPQQIVAFSREDVPVSIGIVFDVSGSMSAQADRAGAAVSGLFQTANPLDEALLVEFSNRPQLAVPMTRNLTSIQGRLTEVTPKGRTALLDGIYLALDSMKAAHNPGKVLIVISDGADNNSRYKATEVASLIRETDVQIYTIALDTAGRERLPGDMVPAGLLRWLSEPTGGRSFFVENAAEFTDIGSKIGIDLRERYLLSYTPTNQANDGKFRKITVKLTAQPGMRVFSKAGYFAPAR